VQSAIETLVADAKTAHYQGYVLDLEGTGGSGSSDYTTFVARLGSALHAAGLHLMVDVLPLPNTRYPYQTLAKSADYLDLLAYPEYSTTGPTRVAPNPGPTEGVPFVQQAIQQASAVVPADQLVLGLALYGQSWTYTSQGFQGGAVIADRTIESSLQSQPGVAPSMTLMKTPWRSPPDRRPWPR
jgi:spore germination protein YaaH